MIGAIKGEDSMRKRDKILLILGLFVTVALSSAMTTVLIAPRITEAYDSDLEWRIIDLDSKIIDLYSEINDLERKIRDLEWRVDDLEH